MRCSHVALVAIIGVTVARCSDASGPPSTLVTRIDRAALDSTNSLVVSFTITNAGQRSEDVPACGGQVGPRIQKELGVGWEEFAGGLCLAIYSTVPIALPPGASVSGTTGAWRGGAGRYRLVISYGRDGLPRAVSAPFTVE